MYDLERAREYCSQLGMLVGDNVAMSQKDPDKWMIKFFDDHWEFWSCNIMCYKSTEDNLSHAMENNSAIQSNCPICDNEECCAYYFEETDVTLFWNCATSLKHTIALYGYRLSASYKIYFPQDNVIELNEALRMLHITTIKEHTRRDVVQMLIVELVDLAHELGEFL